MEEGYSNKWKVTRGYMMSPALICTHQQIQKVLFSETTYLQKQWFTESFFNMSECKEAILGIQSTLTEKENEEKEDNPGDSLKN